MDQENADQSEVKYISATNIEYKSTGMTEKKRKIMKELLQNARAYRFEAKNVYSIFAEELEPFFEGGKKI